MKVTLSQPVKLGRWYFTDLYKLLLLYNYFIVICTYIYTFVHCDISMKSS